MGIIGSHVMRTLPLVRPNIKFKTPGRGASCVGADIRHELPDDQPFQFVQRAIDIVCWQTYICDSRNRMSKSNTKQATLTADRDLYSGLIRLHVLHHAVEEPIFGLGMIEELARHGYRISPGSLYPVLHGLEKKGYLRTRVKRNGKSLRKEYRATPQGRKALAAAKNKVRELFHELIEGE